MSLRPTLLGVGTPSTKGTGLICRIPSPRFVRYALGFSPRGTCVSSRYEHDTRLHRNFHGHQGSTEADNCPPHRAFSRFSPLRSSAGLYIWTPWRGCSVYPDASNDGQNMPWCRNINLLPFRHLRLRDVLGSTIPRLMSIVEEP